MEAWKVYENEMSEKEAQDYASRGTNASVCSFTQSCLTLCNPTDCSPPGSSVRGIFQARVLEWAVISINTENCFLELQKVTDENF